jgi:hypothetical protein
MPITYLQKWGVFSTAHTVLFLYWYTHVRNTMPVPYQNEVDEWDGNEICQCVHFSTPKRVILHHTRATSVDLL